MAEQKEAVIAEPNDGTIRKSFLIDGGRFIVEVNVTDGVENTMFSIRGVVDSKNIPVMLQTSEQFLKEVISSKGCSGK